MAFRSKSAIVFISAALSIIPANASETGRVLPNALGIASPSTTTLLLGENPAGFSYVSSIKLQALGYSDNDSSEKKYWNAGLYAGTGSFGFGIASEKYTAKAGDQQDPMTYWGIGGGMNGVAIGAGGFNIGGNNPANHTEFGVLFGTRNALTIGGIFSADVQSSYDWGAGIAYDASPGINFALDTHHNRTTGDIGYAAGIKLGAPSMEVMLAYRLTDKNNVNEEHFVGGLAYFFSQSIGFEFMYNYQLKYLLGLTVRFT